MDSLAIAVRDEEPKRHEDNRKHGSREQQPERNDHPKLHCHRYSHHEGKDARARKNADHSPIRILVEEPMTRTSGVHELLPVQSALKPGFNVSPNVISTLSGSFLMV